MRRVAALAAGLALVAGCGSDEGAPSSGSASGGANVAAAQRLLDKYSAEPTFSPPGEAFDAKAGMQGKKIMEIPVTSEIPLTQVISKEMATQAERIGFELQIWENQGQSDQWVRGMETAIAQDYDAIDLLGIDPKLLKPQIDKARAAGIKVTSSHLAGFGCFPVAEAGRGAAEMAGITAPAPRSAVRERPRTRRRRPSPTTPARGRFH